MESKFISYQNKNIHYKLYGQGHPVVLLHGLPVNSDVWKELAMSLQNEFMMITPDIPGSGQSEMLVGEKIGLGDYAKAIKAILDEETITICTMIGHSMGGYITLAFAEKYPELLNGIGLFHSSAYADDEEKKQTRSKAIEFIRVNGAYAFLKTSTPNLFAGKEHLEEMNAIIEEGKDYNPASLIQYYEAMIARPDRTEILKTIDRPVLFIVGEKDTVIPLPAALQQSHLPARAYVHILNTGHMGMIEDSNKSQLIVKTFLETI